MTPRPALLLLACLPGCLGVDPLTEGARERVAAIDFYWQQLADHYLLFGRSGVDWDEIQRQYHAAAPFAARPHEFLHLVSGMLSELGDPHVSYEAAEGALVEDGVAPTSLMQKKGFELMPIEGRLFVVGWPDGEAPIPPEGLPPEARYPELWRVEGAPVVVSLVGNLMLGPPGSDAELQLRWRDGTVTRHVLQRPPSGTRHTSHMARHLRSDGLTVQRVQSEPYARIDLRTFSIVPLDRIDEWIDEAPRDGGLVLDLRRNLGGEFKLAAHMLGRFLAAPVELVFVPRDANATVYLVVPLELFVQAEIEPRGERFDGPIVVLTSGLTMSMAEHAARILQRHCGAIVVGERTGGAEAGLEAVRGPEGGELKFGGTRVVDQAGVGLQGEGVVPDVSVKLTLADVERLGPDGAAEDWEARLTAAAEAALERVRSARQR